MDELNQELRELIIAVQRQPTPSPLRKQALTCLLIKVQALPGILRSTHEDYPEALNRTWEWVCKNIDEFNTDRLTLAEDLTKWINDYLSWRIRKLYSSDEQLNHELRDLIIEVCRHPSQSPLRQQALDRLLTTIQSLPGILQSPHPNYREALNRTWQWVGENLEKFNTDTPTVARNLTRWINGYLKWRIHDLYSSDNDFWNIHVSLDEPIQTGENNRPVTLSNLLAAPNPPPDEKTLGEKLREYIEQDPDGRLRQCHRRNSPECNAQFLALRLFLQEPPVNFMVISRELGINHQNLRFFWNTKCLPLLRTIAKELDKN